MTGRNTPDGLDFEALRESLEGCDLDLMLAFYAEDAELNIVNAGTPPSLSFKLRGKAEIAKHLSTAYGQETSHRVEWEVVGKNRVMFQEACDYPDGSRVRVETTLEVPDGKIVRQVDVVAQYAKASPGEEISLRPPVRDQPEIYEPGPS